MVLLYMLDIGVLECCACVTLPIVSFLELYRMLSLGKKRQCTVAYSQCMSINLLITKIISRVLHSFLNPYCHGPSFSLTIFLSLFSRMFFYNLAAWLSSEMPR
jgi:hypothetical protein